MENSIIIDVGISYTRISICNNQKLNKLILENNNNKQIQGTIYQGMVSNIVKGMKAAFIEIGTEHKGFLHFDDIPDQLKTSLQNNKRIAVQVVKEGINNKGPKVTSYYSIKGKYVVLLPFDNSIGISKKIKNIKERDRLRSLALDINNNNYGLIVRTEAEGISEFSFQKEITNLIRTWEGIKPKIASASIGETLYQEPTLIIKTIREYINEDTKEIVINDESEGKNIINYLNDYIDNASEIVRIVDKTSNLYISYGIEKDINKALRRHIWLKSGANIVIDTTEAMNVIDVNSAKLIGIKSQDKMILKANMEAAKESARQIKIRNLSGIIVIDFIDMKSEEDKAAIFELIKEEFKDDDSRVKIYPINELGLLQMTRQKKYNSLRNEIMEKCEMCNNHYGNKTLDYQLVIIEQDIRDLIRDKINRVIDLEISLELYKYIINHDINIKFELKYEITLNLIKNDLFTKNQYKLSINPNKKIK